jgi:BirA family biotin operon repressor/biotin-[acetyl-CoA-carboxylase] ligase
MPMDIARLRAESWLIDVEWLDRADSTNDRGLSLASQPTTRTPLLIGADRQDAGRGRGANHWWGADGALMFSVVVSMRDFGLSQSAWPRFSLVTGIAISETLGSFLPASGVGLKWPNDVWLSKRKVCGILIEQGALFPDRLVVGIGLNVNNSFEAAPADQRAIATSMVDAAHGVPFSRTDVLLRFLDRWRALVQQLADGDVNLVARWSQFCVLSGNPVTVTSGHQETTGMCVGIDDDGSLLLRTAFSTERCYAGTVRLLDTS